MEVFSEASVVLVEFLVEETSGIGVVEVDCSSDDVVVDFDFFFEDFDGRFVALVDSVVPCDGFTVVTWLLTFVRELFTVVDSSESSSALESSSASLVLVRAVEDTGLIVVFSTVASLSSADNSSLDSTELVLSSVVVVVLLFEEYSFAKYGQQIMIFIIHSDRFEKISWDHDDSHAYDHFLLFLLTIQTNGTSKVRVLNSLSLTIPIKGYFHSVEKTSIE